MRYIRAFLPFLVFGLLFSATLPIALALFVPLPSPQHVEQVVTASPLFGGGGLFTGGKRARLGISELSGTIHNFRYSNHGTLEYFISDLWRPAVNHPAHRASSVSITACLAGFPMPAFEGTRLESSAYYVTAPTETSAVGASSSNAPWRPASASTVIPFRLLLPGFIADALFWSLIALTTLSFVRALRRMGRQLRGRCGQCGHPRLDLDCCSECGARLGKSRPVRVT